MLQLFISPHQRSDFAAVLNVRALDAHDNNDDKVREIPMSSNGPWTKYGAAGALDDSGSMALSSALFRVVQLDINRKLKYTADLNV